MFVEFKNSWFSPEGTFYRAELGVQEVPDKFRKDLPSSAQIVKAEEAKKKKADKKKADEKEDVPKAMSEVGQDRAAQKALDEVLKKKKEG